jgi:hypothetical protein
MISRRAKKAYQTVVMMGPLSLLIRTAAVALLVAACAGQGPAIAPPATATSPVIAPTGAPTIDTPAPQPTFPPEPDPSHLPAGFIESFGQPTEEVGGHGGSPDVALPASVAIDYWVSGTCDFRIDILDPAATDLTPVATFAMRMLGSTVSGTWPVSIKAGRYYVTPLDTPGCRFYVTVRAAG